MFAIISKEAESMLIYVKFPDSAEIIFSRKLQPEPDYKRPESRALNCLHVHSVS